jgi:uncharacterized protein (TIGR03663 family)
MPQILPRWLPLALLALATLLWRSHDLASRPMHADEANQAVKAGELLESGRYAYDPGDHHGPVLYYAVLPFAWLRGQHTLADLDEVTVRLVTVVAGALSVLLVGLLALPLGRWPALAAAAFMAASPPADYYSRYFVQETLLAAFTLASLLCARQWWRSGRLGWAVAAGVCAGLMQASKESAPLFALGALAAFFATNRSGPPEGLRCARDGMAAAAASLAVWALLYSSFGTHLSGLRDALAAYGHAASRLGAASTGHEKPWWYFLRLLTWQRSGGLVFEQAGFAALAMGGGVVALFRPDPLLRWAAAYSGLVLAAFSLMPYKTPWHAVDLVPSLAVLAAGALASAPGTRAGRWCALAVALAVLASLGFQSYRVSRVYPADPRNPYAYVHSAPDVLKIRALAVAALGRSPGSIVRVVSEEYWPLPWYLRGLGRVGYWTQPPADCDASLVITSAGLSGEVSRRLHGAYDRSYLGLRPGFVCVVFTRKP